MHRLVKIVFHGFAENCLAVQVNHLDRNSSNNRLDNLEWVTSRENIIHSYGNPSKASAGPKLSMPVRCRAVESNHWKAYASMREAAKALGMSPTSVAKSCAQNTVVKGYECRLAGAGEQFIGGEEWKEMIYPKTGHAISGKMISSCGRFKSKAGKVFTGSRRKDGYQCTKICLDFETKYRNVLVHQLVARAFLWPPPSPLHTQVNHKDGNRANNSVTNLEYVTPAQNIVHSYRRTPTRTYSKVRPLESRLGGGSDQWTGHPSVRSAERQLGVSSSNIHACLKGRRKHARGYEFRFQPPALNLPSEEWREIDPLALR